MFVFDQKNVRGWNLTDLNCIALENWFKIKNCTTLFAQPVFDKMCRYFVINACIIWRFTYRKLEIKTHTI